MAQPFDVATPWPTSSRNEALVPGGDHERRRGAVSEEVLRRVVGDRRERPAVLVEEQDARIPVRAAALAAGVAQREADLAVAHPALLAEERERQVGRPARLACPTSRPWSWWSWSRSPWCSCSCSRARRRWRSSCSAAAAGAVARPGGRRRAARAPAGGEQQSEWDQDQALHGHGGIGHRRGRVPLSGRTWTVARSSDRRRVVRVRGFLGMVERWLPFWEPQLVVACAIALQLSLSEQVTRRP